MLVLLAAHSRIHFLLDHFYEILEKDNCVEACLVGSDSEPAMVLYVCYTGRKLNERCS